MCSKVSEQPWAFLSEEPRRLCDDYDDELIVLDLRCFEKLPEIRASLSKRVRDCWDRLDKSSSSSKKPRLDTSKMWRWRTECVCPGPAALAIPEDSLPACALQAPSHGQSGSACGGEK